MSTIYLSELIIDCKKELELLISEEKRKEFQAKNINEVANRARGIK